MNDNQIIDLFWAKNRLAISATAEKYGSFCFSVAYNILYDRLDWEEYVNDMYLAAWNSISPQKPNRLLAFLGKITRNLAFNRYKRNRAAKRGKVLLKRYFRVYKTRPLCLLKICGFFQGEKF